MDAGEDRIVPSGGDDDEDAMDGIDDVMDLEDAETADEAAMGLLGEKAVSSLLGDGSPPPNPSVSAVQFCCDLCQTCPITVCRWHCETCQDFDLCDACYRAGGPSPHISPIAPPPNPHLPHISQTIPSPPPPSMAISHLLTRVCARHAAVQGARVAPPLTTSSSVCPSPPLARGAAAQAGAAQAAFVCPRLRRSPMTRASRRCDISP